MSFDFAELGATLAIGIYLVVGVEFLLFAIFGKTFWVPLSWLQEKKKEHRDEPTNEDAPKKPHAIWVPLSWLQQEKHEQSLAHNNVGGIETPCSRLEPLL
jgi:hypothetical protein